MTAPNYWIFQATPEVFDLRTALKNDALRTFAIRAHRDKIKTGDKVILWLTGEATGCYALGEVISAVEKIAVADSEKPFFVKEKDRNALNDRVKLRIEHNLWNRPIHKDDLHYIDINSLNINIPGTNFAATKAQYDAFLQQITMDSQVQEPSADYRKPSLHPPLNQILFGPPGTGKTFLAINHALSIIEDKPLSALAQEPRRQLHERFEEYKAKGQIQMLTFHPSFAYEDFMEGIKPLPTEDKQVYYDIEDGVFKEIALRAAQNQSEKREILLTDKTLAQANFYKISLKDYNSQGENDDVYKYCLNNNCIALGWGDQIDFSEAKTEREIKERFQLSGITTTFDVGAIKYFKLHMKKGDLVFVSKGNFSLAAIGIVEGDYFFDKNTPIAYSQFRKVKWLYKNLDIPVKDFYQKNFSQMAIYQLDKQQMNLAYFQKRKAGTSENNRYVLIIDEINRGNISAIFGELLTLIEPDKRKGAPEALSVQLPYSKTTFTVPQNLYLLGTMNTADRSAEMLDNALRRRFAFVEMPARPELLPMLNNIDLAKLLTAINQRIEILLDKEHHIGHAFLMNLKSVEALQKVFHYKIIPLLQEYFYGDWGKIGLILGKAFVIAKFADNSSLPLFADFDYENKNDYSGHTFYRITPKNSWDEAAFIAIYKA